MKRRKWKGFLVTILLFLAILAAGGLWVWKSSEDGTFETTFYRVASQKIGEPVRALLLSDLHNREYGENNEELINQIENLQPDLILMTGDMVNNDNPDTSVVVSLCEQLGKTAPVYYILGNHEGDLMYLESGYQVALDTELFQIGTTVLYNNSIDVEVKGNQLSIGVSGANPENYESISSEFIKEFEQKSEFKILLSHYPTLYYECLADANIDLAVAGHFHGGLIRLPDGTGLYHKDTGLFPKYCYGKNQLKNGVLVVSRGLGNHGKIPRINNKPELVVIDISHT